MSDLNPYEESLAFDLAKAQERIGKSTLLLQAAAIFATKGLSAVYVSGEEATAQPLMRARTTLAELKGRDDE